MAGKANRIGKSKRASEAAPAATAETPPEPSPSTEKFAGKAHNLEALREAVVDAASVGAGLWLSYLLASKVGAFHAALQAQIGDDDTRARLRRQLPSNIFVQYLAGPEEVRTGVMGLMLRGIAIITLVIFPICLLVFFQLQFLPYHSAPITWWQRFAVLIDLILLWTLWPSIAVGEATWIHWRDFRRPKISSLALASLVPLLLVCTIATFPGEWLDSCRRCGGYRPNCPPRANLQQSLTPSGPHYTSFLWRVTSTGSQGSRQAYGPIGWCFRASTSSIMPNSTATQRSMLYPRRSPFAAAISSVPC